MTFVLRRLTITEVAVRLAPRINRGGWSSIVVPIDQSAVMAEQLAADIDGLTGQGVRNITAPISARGLVELLDQAKTSSIVIVSNLDHFSPEDWGFLDISRSRLMRDGLTILVLSKSAAETMAETAPNLSSWIGGSIWEVGLTPSKLSPVEREARLTELRTWSRLTDDEVIRRAQHHALGREPEFAEWLVLLGRADLIGS